MDGGQGMLFGWGSRREPGAKARVRSSHRDARSGVRAGHSGAQGACGRRFSVAVLVPLFRDQDSLRPSGPGQGIANGGKSGSRRPLTTCLDLRRRPPITDRDATSTATCRTTSSVTSTATCPVAGGRAHGYVSQCPAVEPRSGATPPSADGFRPAFCFPFPSQMVTDACTEARSEEIGRDGLLTARFHSGCRESTDDGGSTTPAPAALRSRPSRPTASGPTNCASTPSGPTRSPGRTAKRVGRRARHARRRRPPNFFHGCFPW